MYELIFDKKVISKLKKYNKDLKKRIFNKIMETKQNPFNNFIKLKNTKIYKLRVGDYRILADIDIKNKKILILEVGHRRNIYKKI